MLNRLKGKLSLFFGWLDGHGRSASGRWRMAIIVSTLVVALSAVVGSLLLFKPTTMAAGTTTATVYFNRNNPHKWNQWGDSGWMVWIDVTINGETRSVWGAADCTMPGVPYPIVKNYYGVSLSYTDTDASGNAYFEGYISAGTTRGQELKVYFTTAVEQPYQPVTKSQANPAVTQIGQTLADDLTVYEADKNGNQVNSKFQWRKSGGKFINAHVCVNVYGPFLKDQPRIPGLDVAGDGYFGTSSYTPPPTLDNNQVTIIGDEVSAAIGNQLPSTNIHTAAGRGFLDGLNVINSIAITDYVVYALGTNDVAAGHNITENDFQTVKDAILAKNSKATVVFVTVYDGNLPLDARYPANLDPQYGYNINQRVRDFNDLIVGDHSYKTDQVKSYDWYGEVAYYDGAASAMLGSDKIKPSAIGAGKYAAALTRILNDLQGGGDTSYGGVGHWGLSGSNPAGAWRNDSGKYKGYQCYDTGDMTSDPGSADWRRSLAFNNLLGNPTGITNSDDFSAGKYYFVSHVTKADNPEVLLDDWHSPFAESSETTTVQFQPYVTSQSNSLYVDSTKNISDRLTSHVADSLSNAENNVPKNIRYWQGLPVKVCVALYGPYQTPESLNITAPAYNANDPKMMKNICSDQTAGGDFTAAEQTRDFDFGTTDKNGSLYKPGYYYFVSRIEKAVQAEDIRGLIISDWTAKFNPSDEIELVIRKFQIKPTSQTATPSSLADAALNTIKTDIIGDANHDGKNEAAGEPTKNNQHTTWDRDAIPVLKPSDKYIEDSFDIRAYDTNSPDDSTANANDADWLKDLHGNFISFYVCAAVYGPYQQPQGAGNSSGSAPRSPAVSIGQTTAPNIPNNYNGNQDSRQQCFWTNAATSDPATATSGLVVKPSASGGPGVYTVRWDNQATNYFLPGYYYVVWNVIAESEEGDCSSNATANTNCTTVQTDAGSIADQKNGAFLESSWWSPFGEQTESFYSPFQPIAKSNIAESTETGSDNISGRKKSAANSGDGGIILECDENKYSSLVNFVNNPEEFPHEKLHCHHVADQIFLGAVDDKAIDRSSHEVSSNHRDEYWSKNKDGVYEPVKFQAKLYGPFKYPYSRTPTDDNKAGWAGDNLVTVVPKDTDGKAVEAAQVYSQPIAESCVISTANVGPNWGGTPAPYDAVFTQDIGSCQGGTPSDSTIELTPGFYVSVVEIVRDDIQNTNPKFAIAACDPTKVSIADRQSNSKCSTQTMTRPHNMLIEDRFTSAWGDRRESLLVPIPLYIITRRDNSAQDTFVDQVTINDRYWIAGFGSEYVDSSGNKQKWTDIWGDPILDYGLYSGQAGYITNGNLPPKEYKYSHSDSGVGDYYSSDQPGDVHVNLYGPYPLENGRPSENPEYCAADKLVRNGTWRLPAKDTGPSGADLPYPAPLTLYEKGWYVFQYTYNGGDRITNIKTQCGDTNEMFRIVKDGIGLVTTAGSDNKTAPTRVLDIVQVTGSFQESDKNSIVKLSLYKRTGTTNSPGITGTDGAPLCTVIFTVSAAGTYSIADHLDAKGYPLSGEKGSGRCFAETGGHYYWIEEFLRPGSDPLNPTPSDHIQPPGKGDSPEDIDILPPPKPEVTTDADPTTNINKPFRDTALVTNIPDGNTKVYKLWFTAYGPFADGRVDCSSQLIYSNQSSPIDVTKNGRYESEYITVASNGIVYWVEHLDDEDGNTVDEGECGARRENTYVTGPSTPGGTTPFEPFHPFQVLPSYPNAGYISQQLGKIIALGSISMLGAWQLTNKNSWLLRKR